MKRSAQRTPRIARTIQQASVGTAAILFFVSAAHAEAEPVAAPKLTPPAAAYAYPNPPANPEYVTRKRPSGNPSFVTSYPRQKPLAPVRILLTEEPAETYPAPVSVQSAAPAPLPVTAPEQPAATPPSEMQATPPAVAVSPETAPQLAAAPIALPDLAPAAAPPPPQQSITPTPIMPAEPQTITGASLAGQTITIPAAPPIAGSVEIPPETSQQAAPVSPVVETETTKLPASVAKTLAVENTPVSLPDTLEPVKDALSPETKAILNQLPSDLAETKKKPAPKLEHFAIDRVNPAAEIFGDAEYDSTEAVGVKIEVKKPSPSMNHILENAYEALINGQSEEAISLYQSVLDQDADNELALFGLATTYHRLGLLDQARPVYGRLLRINPNHKEGLANFLSLVAEESPQEALVELQKLEAKNPGFSPIPAQIGLIYKKLGDLDNAAKSMGEAVRISPENLAYRYNLAVILDKLGNTGEAATLYSQLIAANERGEPIPGDPHEIQERLTFIRSN